MSKRYGPWAVVTGASSGIGQQFAEVLASRGFHLVVTARRLELLEDLKQRLEAMHGGEVIAVQADLSRDNGCEPLLRACDGRDIGLLVSNAGSGIPGDFATCELARELELIRLNCATPATLVRHFLPRMRESGRGGIILVSSLLGFQGVPFLANYSATKGFLLNFGEALHHENKAAGVDVLVLAPGATATPGRYLHPVDYTKLPISWMPPERVVDLALRALGRKALLIPGRRNHLAACLSGGLWTRGLVQGVMRRLAQLALPGLQARGQASADDRDQDSQLGKQRRF